MVAALAALLITISVNPYYCQAPCTINTLVHLEFKDLKGEVCLHLIPVELKDDDDHTKSCWPVDPTDTRFFWKSFLKVGPGTYVEYVTLDGKQVSNKPVIRVLGRFENEKVKNDQESGEVR